MEQKFKVGDVVDLKSGGPEMTIEGIDKYKGSLVDKALCSWFVSGEKKSDVFTLESLSFCR